MSQEFGGLRLLAGVLARVTLAAAVSAAVIAPAMAKGPTGYYYYVVGNPNDVVLAPSHRPRTAGAVLMGGGPDVDDAFRWMIAKSGGGDFVVIRATGADGYNPYVFEMGGVDSVETLVITTRDAASDPFVLDRVNRAEALFIGGGDQSDYINLWRGTPLETAIKAAISRKAPIGGTSAGLAVLGEFDFAALNGTVYSDDALADPYNRRVTLDRDFITLPGLSHVITDAHLDSRDRMGRLVTFLARLVQDGWAVGALARGIGLDVETALVVDNGVATRVGVGAAYFVQSAGPPQVCQSGTPLTYRDLVVQRMSGGGTFSLDQWASYDGATVNYRLSAEEGVLTSTQEGGSIY